MKYLSLFLLALHFLLPVTVRAETVDLSIAASSIRFSKDVLIVGDDVRIYATIKNMGTVDVTAQVFFYQGNDLIGKSQPVSVVADGGRDDVFVDFTLPDDSFNIKAEIRGTAPEDQNLSNNEALTPLYRPLKDTDADGILDENDNCPEMKNADQEDLDKDLKGDVCDTDQDGDGVVNDNDEYPTDPTRSAKPKPVVEKKPAVPPPPAPKESQPAPTPTVQTPVAEPVPQVLGEKQEVAEPEVAASSAPAPEGEELALNLNDFGYGSVTQSPQAQFSYYQVDWRTYAFEAVPPLGGSGYTYAWDFGDGATSVQQHIVHAFPKSGVYNITLATVDENGAVTSDAQVIDVSFFHLANPLLQVTVAVLLGIIGGLLILIMKLRRGKVADDEV